jgi:hypothetical protein
MRKSLTVSVLLLALCRPAFAGDMLCPPVTTPPPPQPAIISQESASEVEIQSVQTTDGETADDLTTNFVEVVLNLLALF